MADVISPSWDGHVGAEFNKPYMQDLRSFLKQEISLGKIVFPPSGEIFSALKTTDYENVKVVIIGQDPYHGEGQAHGLCFSVKPGVRTPPSLINIFKEMKQDLGIDQPGHGYLQSWAEQGVLLLNSVLSVEMGQAGSHQKRGWEQFTDRVIEKLNVREQPTAFVLWGAYAQKKGALLDRSKHLVLESVHPSPLSANRGFFGCRHFSKINLFLEANGLAPIDWQLPPLN